jgi:hypothetical protein
MIPIDISADVTIGYSQVNIGLNSRCLFLIAIQKLIIKIER